MQLAEKRAQLGHKLFKGAFFLSFFSLSLSTDFGDLQELQLSQILSKRGRDKRTE